MPLVRFTAHRAALPQAHGYHLVYRHCLHITGDGQTLAFGSATGSVWVSEDSGQRWERISAELHAGVLRAVRRRQVSRPSR